MATSAMAASQATAAITSAAAATSSSHFTATSLLHHPWASLPALSRRKRSKSGRLIYSNNGDARVPPPSRGSGPRPVRAAAAGAGAEVVGKVEKKVIHGKCFVVGDNIDTDQIIPAEYLTLVPSKPDEYEKLGSYAMIGLSPHYGKFMEDGMNKSEYAVMIAGANFGCGSSREHAPVALGAAGVRAVVAESFARIFFRNSVATGELYPVETETRICEENKTGDLVTVDLEHELLINHTSGKQFKLIPIGDAGPVIDAGGIFNFARASGMIGSPP